jgi:hypothetical protein
MECQRVRERSVRPSMGAVVIWRQLPLQRGRGIACERPDVLIAVLAALVMASGRRIWASRRGRAGPSP